MARLFVSGARVVGGALLALVAMGPGCTGGEGDDEASSGGSAGAGEGDGDSDSGTGGLSVDGPSTGGTLMDGDFDGSGGVGEGGSEATGGEGGLGGGTPVCSDCAEAQDLGAYAAGESLPWLPYAYELLPGESDVFGITFLDTVWFGGELITTGTGTPQLTLLDDEGDELASFTGTWENHLLAAGDYYLRIAPQGSTPLSEGYDLDMLTRNPFPVGTVGADSSTSTSALFDFAGQFHLYKFVVAAPMVLTGNITLASGNVDVFIYDSAAEVVASFQSPGDTETVGPLELPEGTYMLQVVGVTSTADFMALFEWDEP